MDSQHFPHNKEPGLQLRRTAPRLVAVTNTDIYPVEDITFFFSYPGVSKTVFVTTWHGIHSGQTRHLELPPELHNTALSIQVSYLRAIRQPRVIETIDI